MSINLPFNSYPVLIDALQTWGVDEQFGMANEEFAECITAINQFKRGRICREKLASEIADVFIMANQLAIIAGEPEVQEQIEYKLNRLKDRLEKMKAVQGTEHWVSEYAAVKELGVKLLHTNGGTLSVEGLVGVQPEDPQPV